MSGEPPPALPPPIAQLPPSLVPAPIKYPSSPPPQPALCAPPQIAPSSSVPLPAPLYMGASLPDVPARPPRTSLHLNRPPDFGNEISSQPSGGSAIGTRFHSPPRSMHNVPQSSGSQIRSARGPAPEIPDLRPRVSVDIGEMKRQGRSVQNRTLVAQETLYLNDLGTWIQDRGKLDNILQGEGKGKEDEKKKKEKKKNKSKKSNIFGMSLEEMYSEHASAVPVIILECIKYFKKSGALKQEGIFRVSGNQANVNDLINLYVSPSSSPFSQITISS